MAAPPLPDDIVKLSFEDALAELEQIVTRLEAGRAKLDDAIAAYERGALLKRHCEAKLQEAKMRVDQIQFQPDGSITAKPLDSK
jgi:exodeoxyribonuclease VII small subunit